MDTVERLELEKTIQDVTLNTLNMLIAHNVKGADLIKKGVEAIIGVKDEFEQHYDQLKLILNMLQPLFEVVRDWLAKAYAHLVELFDWAKAKWHEIFG